MNEDRKPRHRQIERMADHEDHHHENRHHRLEPEILHAGKKPRGHGVEILRNLHRSKPHGEETDVADDIPECAHYVERKKAKLRSARLELRGLDGEEEHERQGDSEYRIAPRRHPRKYAYNGIGDEIHEKKYPRPSELRKSRGVREPADAVPDAREHQMRRSDRKAEKHHIPVARIGKPLGGRQRRERGDGRTEPCVGKNAPEDGRRRKHRQENEPIAREPPSHGERAEKEDGSVCAIAHQHRAEEREVAHERNGDVALRICRGDSKPRKKRLHRLEDAAARRRSPQP